MRVTAPNGRQVLLCVLLAFSVHGALSAPAQGAGPATPAVAHAGIVKHCPEYGCHRAGGSPDDQRG